MDPPSDDELRRLAEAFRIPVGGDPANLRDGVADQLADVEVVLDVAAEATAPSENAAGVHSDHGGRTWTRTRDSAHNAVLADCRVRPSGEGPLSGMTAGVKDNIAVAGVPVTCGPPVVGEHVPSRDATVVTGLLAAGATITAKTNLDEFGNTGQGTTGLGGPITNPHDPARTAGGSSGGSAAAVATDRVDVALGTDTGGSVRIPACYCGLVGLKPTAGLASVAGVFENSRSLDHVGPIAGSVGDAAATLEAIAGPDRRDPASKRAAASEEYRAGGHVDAARSPPAPAEITLGVVTDGFEPPIDEDVAERVEAAVDALRAAGVSTRPVSVDRFDAEAAVKRVLQTVENATHWRDDGVPYRRGDAAGGGDRAALAAGSAGAATNPHLTARLLAGAHLVASRRGDLYAAAGAAREVHREAYRSALAGVDALASPSVLTVAPRTENAPPDVEYGRNLLGANLTGFPAVTVPAGTARGLPVGLQLVGAPFRDASLLGVAAAVERVVGDS